MSWYTEFQAGMNPVQRRCREAERQAKLDCVAESAAIRAEYMEVLSRLRAARAVAEQRRDARITEARQELREEAQKLRRQLGPAPYEDREDGLRRLVAVVLPGSHPLP